jgi:hypothetical protein
MISLLETKPQDMNEQRPDYHWDEDLAELLEDLSQVQDELLGVLTRKRQCMAAGDVRGMAALQPHEQELGRRLQGCHDRRATLLAAAGEHGLPGDSLGALANAIDQRASGDLTREVRHSSARMRLLQHESLANWVLAQKALLHVAQLLEIIATGSRLKPTYGKEAGHRACGSLVDQEV